jgi:hypothetical protein
LVTVIGDTPDPYLGNVQTRYLYFDLMLLGMAIRSRRYEEEKRKRRARELQNAECPMSNVQCRGEEKSERTAECPMQRGRARASSNAGTMEYGNTGEAW